MEEVLLYMQHICGLPSDYGTTTEAGEFALFIERVLVTIGGTTAAGCGCQ